MAIGEVHEDNRRRNRTGRCFDEALTSSLSLRGRESLKRIQIIQIFKWDQDIIAVGGKAEDSDLRCRFRGRGHSHEHSGENAFGYNEREPGRFPQDILRF